MSQRDGVGGGDSLGCFGDSCGCWEETWVVVDRLGLRHGREGFEFGQGNEGARGGGGGM